MPPKPSLFDTALAAEGITGPLADLARSIYVQESSGGKNTKTSNRGARGGMQILEGTFKEVADKGWSIDDPVQNARAGIRYLKKMHEYAGGDPQLAAVGYYGGRGGINKARRGVAVSDPKNPKAPNTLEYGREVVARMGGSREAAPAALPQANLQVAAVMPDVPPAPVPGPAARVQTGAVALPPEMLARLSARAPTNYSTGGPDAWQAFLKSMPGRSQPVNVADIDYQNPRMVTRLPEFEANGVSSRKPNFEAFGSWTGRAA